MRRRLALVVIAILVALVGAFTYYALPSAVGEQDPAIPGGIPLVRPAIAQQQGSFLDTEAGMSAYTNTGLPINLNNARNAFRIVERQTTDWIVGTVGLPSGYSEAEDPHVFVHRDGWIIAYYDKDSSVARTVHFATPGTLGVSKLEQALQEVSNRAGTPVQDVGFYDFRFPAATEWLLIIDTNTFSVEIPSQFTVFERSFSVRRDSGSNVGLDIDGIRIVTVISPTAHQYGALSPATLSPDSAHQIGLVNAASLAISLLYTPPAVP